MQEWGHTSLSIRRYFISSALVLRVLNLSVNLGDNPQANTRKINRELIWRTTTNKAAHKTPKGERPEGHQSSHQSTDTWWQALSKRSTRVLSATNSQAIKGKSRKISFNPLHTAILPLPLPTPKPHLDLYTSPPQSPGKGNRSTGRFKRARMELMLSSFWFLRPSAEMRSQPKSFQMVSK